MKAKTISSIVSRKIKQWTASIKDENVRKLAEDNTIVTGGSIVSLLMNNPVNDFDIYFRTQEAALAVARYYCAELVKNPPKTLANTGVKATANVSDDGRVEVVLKTELAGKASRNHEAFTLPDSESDDSEAAAYMEGAINQAEELDELDAKKLNDEKEKQEPFRVVFVTANAITLSDKIQLVLRFYGEPEEIHKNYDFEHCTNYWCSWTRHLTLRPEALESILTKELRYRGSLYPICSVIRTRKFIQLGWTINAGQYLKMCWQISKLNLSDIRVLEDQLVGVDSAFFAQLIKALSEEDMASVDNSKFVSIVDKIF